MANTTPAIEVAGLTKAFGDHRVLDGVDLVVEEGTVHALLGPNGAGKTTTVNVLSTLLEPDGGEVRVAGFDVRRERHRVRAAVGLTGQFSAIDEFLTGRENLRMMADLAHLDRAAAGRSVDELLTRLDLVAAADRRAQTYSGGMKRRLDLAMTLVARPRLIFLDEPTTGLDPRSRREVWSIVREQLAEGVTVLLTTQYLEEADALADRIAVIDGGRVVAEGTAEQLKRRVPGGHLEVQVRDADRLEVLAGRLPGATADREALRLTVPSDGSVSDLRRLLADVGDDEVTALTVHTPDLDDVFLALTGRPADDRPQEVSA